VSIEPGNQARNTRHVAAPPSPATVFAGERLNRNLECHGSRERQISSFVQGRLRTPNGDRVFRNHHRDKGVNFLIEISELAMSLSREATPGIGKRQVIPAHIIRSRNV
jgi:hypothetical protein